MVYGSESDTDTISESDIDTIGASISSLSSKYAELSKKVAASTTKSEIDDLRRSTANFVNRLGQEVAKVNVDIAKILEEEKVNTELMMYYSELTFSNAAKVEELASRVDKLEIKEIVKEIVQEIIAQNS